MRDHALVWYLRSFDMRLPPVNVAPLRSMSRRSIRFPCVGCVVHFILSL